MRRANFHERQEADAARGVRPVQFVIAGTGASRGMLAEQVERECLENILMLPLQAEDNYREMLVDSDCCAITQQPGTGALFFPSKLLTTLAYAKPVLSIADEESDLTAAVKEGDFGVNVLPGSPAAVGAALEQWRQPGADLEAVGQRGRRYVSQFEMRQVLGRFEEELRRVVLAHEPSPTVAVAVATAEQKGLQ